MFQMRRNMEQMARALKHVETMQTLSGMGSEDQMEIETDKSPWDLIPQDPQAELILRQHRHAE